MKDDIKTFAEYRMFVKEYKESDSASRKEAIEYSVFAKARALLHKLKVLYVKYGREIVEDSDYQEDRGWLSLAEFDEDTVWLHYSDRWAYGGECDIGIEVPMMYLDGDEMEVLEKGLREEHTERVKKQIQEKRDAIEELKKEVEKLEVEVNEDNHIR